MTAEIYLELAEGVAIGLTLREAMTFDEKDFAKLYRTHVYRASRKEAKQWAKKQVADRAFLYGEAAKASL